MIDKPIETMWQAYRKIVVAPDAPAMQIVETQRAFFAGAATLFEMIMNVLDPGSEPTAGDLLNMDKIHAEIKAFGKGFDAEFFGIAGKRPS